MPRSLLRRLLIPSVAVLALAFAVSGTRAQEPQVRKPPAGLSMLRRRGSELRLGYPGLSGWVRGWLRKRELSLDCKLVFSDGTSRPNPQSLAVDFWPTEVIGLLGRPDSLLVAGVTDAGKTLLQLWTLDLTEFFEAEKGSPSRMERFHPRIPFGVKEKRTLLDADVEGERRVRLMLENLGAPGQVFLQFDDSRDLYTIDIGTGSLRPVLLASERVAGPETEVQPGLLLDFNDRDSGDHEDLGYVYFFSQSAACGSGPGMLLMLDGDRDGVLDPGKSRLIDGPEWGALELGDADKYRSRD